MISPRWRKVLRDVWLHKPRTLLVVLAIVVGIAGAGSVLNTWSLVRQVTRDEYRKSNPASATLRSDFIDAATVAAVRARPDIRDAVARRVVVASVWTSGAPHTAMLFALDEFVENRVGRIVAVEGRWPPAEGSMVVERSSMDFAGVALNDVVRVQVGDGAPQELRVAGVARDVGLAPGWMDHVVYGFVTSATLKQLGAPSQMNELQIVVRDDKLDREAIRRVAFKVKAQLERAGYAVSDVEVPVPGRHVHAGQIKSLLFTQGAFGVLALLMSGVLVVNLIAAMLAGQVREIGVMKAIGASTGQVAGMYLGLALVMGVIASLVALPAAAFLGRGYAQFTADLLNFSIAGVGVPLKIYAVQLAVGLLLPVCAAAIPVMHGSRISVGTALRDFGIAGRGKLSGTGLLWRLGGLSRPLLLSLRNAFRRRQRMALTLLTLALGGSVYLGALNLRSAIVGSVELLFRPQHYDMSLSFAESWPAESLEVALTSVAGVANAEAWSGGRAVLQRGEGTRGNSFQVLAPPAATTMFTPELQQGRWLRTGDRNVLVVNTRLLADEPALQVGSTVTLIVAGKAASWMIVGSADMGPSPMAFAPREAMAALVGGGRVTTAVVAGRARGEQAQLELAGRLRTELGERGFGVKSSMMVEEHRHSVEDHLLMVAGFLGAMAQLMIVVGGLGLAATMSLAVLERTREIGVLRAIGARHRSILTMIHVEGLVISLLGWALAVPLSIPMSVILGRAFGRIMLPVPVVYLPHVAGVLSWLAVVVVVSVLACAWPAWRATRITTAAALAYE